MTDNIVVPVGIDAGKVVIKRLAGMIREAKKYAQKAQLFKRLLRTAAENIHTGFQAEEAPTTTRGFDVYQVAERAWDEAISSVEPKVSASSIEPQKKKGRNFRKLLPAPMRSWHPVQSLRRSAQNIRRLPEKRVQQRLQGMRHEVAREYVGKWLAIAITQQPAYSVLFLGLESVRDWVRDVEWAWRQNDADGLRRLAQHLYEYLRPRLEQDGVTAYVPTLMASLERLADLAVARAEAGPSATGPAFQAILQRIGPLTNSEFGPAVSRASGPELTSGPSMTSASEG